MQGTEVDAQHQSATVIHSGLVISTLAQYSKELRFKPHHLKQY
jgi:hypothetical protein